MSFEGEGRGMKRQSRSVEVRNVRIRIGSHGMVSTVKELRGMKWPLWMVGDWNDRAWSSSRG